MGEKDIFRISIIGRTENELDVRCDVDERFYEITAGIIVQELKIRPVLRKFLLNELSKI